MQKDYTFGCVSEEAFRAYFDDVTEYLKQKDISIRAELLLVGEPIERANYIKGLYNRVKKERAKLTITLVKATLHMLSKETIGIVGMAVLEQIESDMRISDEILTFEKYVLSCLTPEQKEHRRKRRRLSAQLALQDAYSLGL